MYYYIIDSNGELFGNRKGYYRHSDALGAATRGRFKLWNIYDNRIDKSSNLIYEIVFR